MEQLMLKINSIDEIQQLAYDITNFATPSTVIALNGDLGAGKTTFTKGIGAALEVDRVINSPTFTIMKIYEAHKKINGIDKLYHLDVYRLDDSSSDFELEEYFYLNGLTIVEWANIIKDILPENTWEIDIYRLSETTRKVVLSKFPENILKKLGDKYEIISR